MNFLTARQIEDFLRYTYEPTARVFECYTSAAYDITYHCPISGYYKCSIPYVSSFMELAKILEHNKFFVIGSMLNKLKYLKLKYRRIYVSAGF